MNISEWIVWALVVLMFILSLFLLTGKGAILIAGYNTSSKEEKRKYNEKLLCRVSGVGLAVITVFTGISAAYKFELPTALSWIVPWGLLVTVAVVLVLSNTICKANVRE